MFYFYTKYATQNLNETFPDFLIYSGVPINNRTVLIKETGGLKYLKKIKRTGPLIK